MGTPEDVAAEEYFTPPVEREQRYHWSFQCQHCFIKSGYGLTGTISEAYVNAPTCCRGEAMQPVRGNKVKGFKYS